MNISTRSRIVGSAAAFGLLVALSACGSETVTETDPGVQPAQSVKHPRTGHGGISADAAERQSKAAKARAERADALRAAHGQQVANQLDNGHPGRS